MLNSRWQPQQSHLVAWVQRGQWVVSCAPIGYFVVLGADSEDWDREDYEF